MQKLQIVIPSFFVIASIFTGTWNGITMQDFHRGINNSTKEPKWTEANITYYGDGVLMKGYLVYDQNIAAKRPAVLVVHEWWGLTDYPKFRARELAKLGYVAMAVDIYGNGKIADNPDSAGQFAMRFYQNPVEAKARLDAAIDKLKTFSQVDTSNIAAIGYCFGGSLLLNAARQGINLKGVVSFHGSPIGSFHGNSSGGTPLIKELLKSKILVCHGAIDPYVPKKDVDLFKKQMDSIGAPYVLKVYEGATHAFTNPQSTGLGKKFNLPIAYNGAADTASWKDMQIFFHALFK